MKQYTKDGEIKSANRIIVVIDGMQVVNPTEEQILADGWVEYVAPEPDKDEIFKAETESKVNNMVYRVNVASMINTFKLTNKEALAVKEYYPEWKEDLGEVKQGEKYQLNDNLYEVVQDHTTQANWSPEKQSSLWEEVVEDHEGTLEDSIPYNEAMNPQWQGMILEEGKYYTQGGVIYKCIRNTGNKVTQNLADLVSGGFVEQAK